MRATPLAREVWLGLICICADDEGRFEADTWGLTERLFPRTHPATEEAVAECLAYWQKAGWLLIYDGSNGTRYGFLQGWFEHQYIKIVEPSSFPPPPVLVASWRDVQSVKRWHTNERGGNANTHFRTVLRDYGQAVQTDKELTTKKLLTKYGVGADKVPPEVKGSEVNPKEGKEAVRTRKRETPAPPTAPPALAEQGTATPNTTRPPATPDGAVAAARAFYGAKQPPGGWKKYEQALRDGLEIAGDRLPVAFLCAAFDQASEHRPLPGEWADAFLKRLVQAAANGDDENTSEQEKGRRRVEIMRLTSDAIDAGDDERVSQLREEYAAL